jgi:hypothetical protein
MVRIVVALVATGILLFVGWHEGGYSNNHPNHGPAAFISTLGWAGALLGAVVAYDLWKRRQAENEEAARRRGDHLGRGSGRADHLRLLPLPLHWWGMRPALHAGPCPGLEPGRILQGLRGEAVIEAARAPFAPYSD